MTFTVNYQQRHLRDKLGAHFDQEEIKSLCFDLHLDWDNLAGEIKRAKIGSLLTELEHTNRLDDLITVVQQLRPNVVWKVGAPADAACPYRGLFAFHEEDAPFFFGRETFTDRLIEAVQRHSLVAVIGPSGSGKSSVVFAGLLPRLRQEGNWLIASFRPGKQPFRALVAALISLLEPDLSETERLLEVRRLAEALAENELLLSDVLGRILEKYSNTARLLFVVDQFEELYSLCPDEGERRRFLDALLATKAEPDLRLVLTLRAGFLGQALAYRPFADALQDSDLKLGPMTREEMQRAIEQPALRVGISFADGLVPRILNDVEGEPGGLPLLEFTLTLLWELQEGGRLTHTAYEALGGVVGALARYADDVYEALSEVEQEQARHVFVQLVQPGTDTGDTRRLASRIELVGVDWRLVQQLANARLVITGQDAAGQQTVELTHEALIQRWLRLRGWVEEERKFRSWQEQLRADLSQWQASGQDDGALLRGGPLAEAESWYQQQAKLLSEPERNFIQASRRLRRRNERLRNTAIVASLVVAMLMLFLAALALSRGAEAERQRRLAVARELAVKSAAMLEVDRQASLRLAVQAVETTYRVDGTFAAEARTALHHALGASYTLSHSSGIYATVFGSDGTHVIPADTEEIPVEVMAAAFSPDNSHIVTVGTDRTVRLWDATGDLLTVAIPTDWSTFFRPSGTHLLVTDSRGYVELWDTEYDRIRAGQPHSQKVNAIAFGTEGNYYVMGSQNGNASLWDLDGNLLNALEGHTGQVESAVFSPDGTRILTGGSDNARLWDPVGNLLKVVEGGSRVWTAVFSPDGSRILTTSSQELRLWQIEGNLYTVLEHPKKDEVGIYFSSTTFSPDGTRIVTTSFDDAAHLWDLEIEGMLAAAEEALEEVSEPDPQAEAQRRLAAEN